MAGNKYKAGDKVTVINEFKRYSDGDDCNIIFNKGAILVLANDGFADTPYFVNDKTFVSFIHPKGGLCLNEYDRGFRANIADIEPLWMIKHRCVSN